MSKWHERDCKNCAHGPAQGGCKANGRKLRFTDWATPMCNRFERAKRKGGGDSTAARWANEEIR